MNRGTLPPRARTGHGQPQNIMSSVFPIGKGTKTAPDSYSIDRMLHKRATKGLPGDQTFGSQGSVYPLGCMRCTNINMIFCHLSYTFCTYIITSV